MTDNSKKTKNSAAKIAANARYNKKAYDHVSIIFKKGTKEKIKAAAESVNESMNQYIVTAVNQRMDKEDDSHKG